MAVNTRDYNRAYYAAHAEHLRAQAREKYRSSPAVRARQSARQKKLAASNKTYQRKWRATNRDKVNAYARGWKRRNPEKVRTGFQAWKKRHPQYFTAYDRNRRANDPAYLALSRLRCRLRKVLAGRVKTASARRLVGCSPEQLRTHIESQFRPGMEWGPRIHIDHIRPCASFDLSEPSQQRACFHYTNLQPLWAHENLAKGSKGAV